MAGAMMALGFADRALAVAPAPTQAVAVPIAKRQAVAARAHLSYKPAVTDTGFEGALTVVEQRIALAAPAVEASPLAVRYLIYTQTSEGSGQVQGAVREDWPRCELAQLTEPPAI